MSPRPEVHESRTEGLFFVESYKTHAGLFWPVQRDNLGYVCPCPGYEHYQHCRHVDAVDNLSPVPPFDTDSNDDPYDIFDTEVYYR